MEKEPITKNNVLKVLLFVAKSVLLIFISASIAFIIAWVLIYLIGN
jgi:hypothetical protein